jgi:hypothetical protein
VEAAEALERGLDDAIGSVVVGQVDHGCGDVDACRSEARPRVLEPCLVDIRE